MICKNSIRKILRCALWLSLVCGVPQAATAEQFPIKTFTSADGLASSAILNVFRDRLGFIWFSTRDGLSRFDGREFTNFRVGGADTSPTVFSFYETRGGDFWIITGDGLYRIKHQDSPEVKPDLVREGADKRISLNAEKISNVSYSVLYEDSDGRIWTGSGAGLFLLNENNGVFSFDKIEIGAVADNVRAISEARDGSLWIGSNAGVFRRLPAGKFLFYPINQTSGSDQVFKIKEDVDGRIWIADTQGIFIIQPEKGSAVVGGSNLEIQELNVAEVTASADFALPLEFPGKIMRLDIGGGDLSERKESEVHDIFEASDSKIWFSAQGFLFVSVNGRVRRVSDSAILPLYIENFAEDMAGNLWIGTGNGALRVTRQGFTTYNRSDGLQDTRIFSILENSVGEILIGNGNLVVSRFVQGSFIARPITLPSSTKFIYATTGIFLEGRDYWVLTENGLFRFDIDDLRKPVKIYGRADGLNGDSMFCAFKDSKGNLWISTRKNEESNGLSLFNKTTGRFHSFSTIEGFPNGKSPVSFAEDQNGNLWFGFYDGGLVRYSDGRFTDFSASKNLPAGGIFGLLVDKKNRLWIASSSGGVAVVDDTLSTELNLKRITTEQGLATNNARSLIDDLSGNVYVGTVRGIDRITPDTGEIRHFSTLDGLSGDFVNLAFRDRAGALWFGTSNGLSKIEPQADLVQAVPEIFISSLQIAGVPYSVSVFGQKKVSGITVNAAENNLEINLLSVSTGGSQHFQYKLENEGNERDWGEATDQRSINLAGLAPGAYEFSVRAINSTGILSETPAIISFQIQPPFWQSWWFRLLVVLVVGALVLAIERTRAARLRALKSAFGKLSVSENRFRQMNEQSPLGIIVFAPDGSIQAVNRSYEQFWGITFEQIKHWDFFADEQLIRIGVVEKLRRVFEGETVHFPAEAYDPGDNSHGVEIGEKSTLPWFESYAYPVKTDGGELLEVILVMEDVTDTKRADEIERKAKTDRLRELEQVRRRIAADLHDDIGSSLTQISIFSEVLQQRVDKSNERLTEPLEFIAGSSRELVDAMSDIVWAINPQKDFLSELSGKMHRFAADVFTARDVAFTFDAPHSREEMALGANIRREVFLIFKESVNNIVKHAQCSAVAIKLSVEKGEIRLSLHDDGRGFDPDKETDGHGLVSMKQRAAGLGGSLSIISVRSNGTTTTLIAPL